ncbi:MAG: sulfate adenylyltransferase subunit CysN [Myxococcota bacterium]
MSHRSDLVKEDIHAYLDRHERKELLRLLTCGSVDDGKSTLIGRLLYDSKLIYDDQLAAIRRDSATVGNADGEFDPALLTDGLRAEREQGITIDVAYRYFSTDKRKFIIADTPGHEQYTRNMATGASNCDLAVILVDARKGVLPQTKRHSFIASLLGIDHVVVAINKMDLVDFDQARYDQIVADYKVFAARLGVRDLHFIPLSALRGDNVVSLSESMPWYRGLTLMGLLETVYVAADRNLQDLRFPVQYVIRPSLDFRGFAGTVASGIVRKGDEVVVLPSQKRSRVESIVVREGQLDEAFPPQAVTLVLEDEIDVSRGDMIVRPDDVPQVSSELEATVVWMAEEAMVPGKEYLLKVGSKVVAGHVAALRHRIDIETLDRQAAPTLKLNEIGLCRFELSAPVIFDAYVRNRSTGAFIIIDRITNGTVGAGMIDRSTNQEQTDRWDAAPRFDLATADSRVTAQERKARFGQAPATVLLTGLSGSGKTTIARGVERRLFERGQTVVVLDGAEMRRGISKDLGFSAYERSENLRRSSEVARLLNDNGILCIGAFVAPVEATRRKAAALVGPERMLVVHVSTSIDVCRERDTEGLYQAADEGKVFSLPGVSFEYEPPPEPDLTLDAGTQSIEQCVDAVVQLLEQRGIIGG